MRRAATLAVLGSLLVLAGACGDAPSELSPESAGPVAHDVDPTPTTTEFERILGTIDARGAAGADAAWAEQKAALLIFAASW